MYFSYLYGSQSISGSRNQFVVVIVPVSCESVVDVSKIPDDVGEPIKSYQYDMKKVYVLKY